MKKILEVPHRIQYYDIDDDKWQGRSCGIVSLAMVLEYYGIQVGMDELIKLGLEKNGYINKIGWKHQIICDLAKHYGLEACRTEEDTVDSLMEALEQNEPVIISIHKNFEPENGGHLTVLNGYFVSNQELMGFYVNDPVGASYKHQNQFIKLEKFLCGWKKRAIYVKKV